MGMFDKDEYYGYPIMDEAIAKQRPFILYRVEIREGFPLEDGEVTDQAILTVAWEGKPNEAFEVSTLGSAIVARAKEQEASDFPVVVFWDKVPNKKEGFAEATVLKKVKHPSIEVNELDGNYEVAAEPVPF